MAFSAYSPADIIARLLALDGQCSAVPDDGQVTDDWPVYVNSEPDGEGVPDDVVTIYDTGDSGGSAREMVTGEEVGPNAFQVRVRASTSREAYAKLNELRDHLMLSVTPGAAAYRRGVSIGDSYYLVHACCRFSDPINLGKSSSGKRSVWVFNAQVSETDQTP